jgi:hypothetical protein
MTSGTSSARSRARCTLTAALLLATATPHAAELDADALLASLVRPPPDTTTFVEVRYSALLATPIVVTGRLEHRANGVLVRIVETPFRETTELAGENVRVEREGSRARQFSLDRAPELRAMLASFGAVLRGDRAQLEHHFAIATSGPVERWAIVLTPRDDRLARRVASMRVDGSGAQPRCFSVSEPDGDASVMAVGVHDAGELPTPLERTSLEAWCASGNGP